MVEIEEIKRATKVIKTSHYAIALSGAGISAESGIPTFRGSQGLWEKYDPAQYAHIDAFLKNPTKVWQMLRELEIILVRAKPNPAHLVLADWERKGYLKAIITQNIDNLHQAAGSQNVIEFHGNASYLQCLKCKRLYKKEEIIREGVPWCDCGGLLKPNVVFFGESIPTLALLKANKAVSVCDVMLLIGTSAEVAPANFLPFEAKRRGVKIIEVNLNSTHLTNTVTDIFLKGKASEVLINLAEAMQENSKGK
jgi:NAD-dependent deacetylase